MKLKSLWIKKYYYKRIIVIMIIFSFLLFLPFAFISYKISQNNILNSINSSNEFMLAQFNNSYGYFSQTNSNICMEAFLNNNVQQMLYSGDIDYNEAYSYIRNVADTTMLTNSSIDSIVIYNNKRNEWFSTDSDNTYLRQELVEFISTQQSIPKLQPILRKVTKKQGNLEVPVYIFSYFMYQFTDPVYNMDSYIVVNENASWFIENIASIKQMKNFDRSIYLINETGIIYRSSGTIDPEIGLSLYDDFWKNHVEFNNAKPKFDFLKHNGNTYLISSMRLGNQENFLIIVQNYNDVFGDLLNMQRDYILFAFVSLIVIIVMLQLFSKRIYSPLQVFINNITKANSAGVSVGNENEFEYLHSIYKNSRDLNNKLQLKSESYEPMIEQLQLIHLTSSTFEYIKEFEKSFPNHWLITEEEPHICVLLIKIDHIENNKYNFEETDINLLAYAVRNIVLELFTGVYAFSSFFQDFDTLCIILNFPDGKSDGDDMIPLLEKCRSFIKQYLDATISVSYSDVDDDILNLDKRFREAKEYLQYRFVFGADHILSRKSCLINLGNEQTNYSNELDENLIASISEKNISSVTVIIDDIKNTLYSFQYAHITICIMALVNKIVITLNQMKRDNRIPANLKTNDLYKKAVDAEFMETLFHELGQYLCSILSDGKDMDGKNRDALNISTVIDFVQNNFGDTNLSSQMISDYMGLSNRYLMHKFKEYTGTSLSEYIANVRMRKAANLLQNTDLPVNKIITQTGIESDTYFYRLFKKIYHCTPREFSEKYRK